MPYGNFGIRRIIDQQLRFRGPGSKAWLRVKNFVDPPGVSEMGFIYTPPSGQQVGFTDIPIQPPPVNNAISMHNLGMAAQAGIALRAGAREIMIAQTFVEAQRLAKGYTEGREVFESANVIGIFTANRLVSIEYIYPDHAYGEVVNWFILGNYNEIK